MQKKSHKKGKYLDSHTCKIFCALPKMNEERNHSEGQQKKEIDDDTQGFIPEEWHRHYESRKEGGK